jgi:hypothetical protein
MINARDARASVQTLDDYITGRIESAVSKGFFDTRMWIKKATLEEATQLLTKNGFRYQQLTEDNDGNKQLEVSW